MIVISSNGYKVSNKSVHLTPKNPQFKCPNCGCAYENIAAPYQGALNPRIAFISDRIALIFQNRFAFTSFFELLGCMFC